jgi:hypothetical protein
VVDQAESTVETRNLGEAVVNQTESMAAKEGESTTAEPKITTKEELEVINLSDDPHVNKPLRVNYTFPP